MEEQGEGGFTISDAQQDVRVLKGGVIYEQNDRQKK
jgi:hypothetical protein